jgi:hemerythrin
MESENEMKDYYKLKGNVMEFRSRPKSNYLLDAEWQELHALTTHWQSDMAYFGDELHFIDLLIDKYFTSFVDKENIAVTKEVAAKLSDTKKIFESLYQKILNHLRHIEKLMVDPLVSDASAFRNEHATLEDELAAFVKNFRDIKRGVFQLTDRVVKTEKQKHLIGN